MKSLLLLFLFTTTITFGQGKLDTAKQDLSSSSSASSSSSNTSSRRSSSSDDNDLGFFGNLLYDATLGIFFGKADKRGLNRHPYYNGLGEYVLDTLQRRSRLRLGGNYVLNKHVRTYELHANYRFIPLLGLDISQYHFAEPDRGQKDFLNSTSIMLNYYRVREEFISAWWGIGGTYVANGVDTWGFAYSFGLEVYASKPVSFHASFKQSRINESKIDIIKLQVKHHLKRVALYAGYQYNLLGNSTISGVSVGIEYTF